MIARRFQAAIWVGLLLASSWPLPCSAAGLPVAAPESVGVSSQRLRRLGAMVQQLVADQQLAGAVVLVARKGRTVYHRSFGAMDMEARAPMRGDAIFRVASMTKLVTTVGAMTLFEEGRLLLDQPASEHVPELERLKVAIPLERGSFELVAPSAQITVRDLLRHTSGISYGFGFNHVDDLYQEASARLRAGDQQHLVDELTRLPLAWQPGTRWEYGFSTDLLGHIVEKVSGERLDEFLATQVFGPLGMTDTGFVVDRECVGRLPNLYRLEEHGHLVLVERAPDSELLRAPGRCSGGGGLVCTAADYARFLQMLLNGGELDGRRVLGRKTVELMLADHLDGIERSWLPPGAGFGLGPAVVADGTRFGELVSTGTFFWAGIYNTYFFVDPQEEVIGILMSQTSPFPLHDLAKRLRVLTMQALVD